MLTTYTLLYLDGYTSRYLCICALRVERRTIFIEIRCPLVRIRGDFRPAQPVCNVVIVDMVVVMVFDNVVVMSMNALCCCRVEFRPLSWTNTSTLDYHHTSVHYHYYYSSRLDL